MMNKVKQETSNLWTEAHPSYETLSCS